MTEWWYRCAHYHEEKQAYIVQHEDGSEVQYSFLLLEPDKDEPQPILALYKQWVEENTFMGELYPFCTLDQPEDFQQVVAAILANGREGSVEENVDELLAVIDVVKHRAIDAGFDDEWIEEVEGLFETGPEDAYTQRDYEPERLHHHVERPDDECWQIGVSRVTSAADPAHELGWMCYVIHYPELTSSATSTEIEQVQSARLLDLEHHIDESAEERDNRIREVSDAARPILYAATKRALGLHGTEKAVALICWHRTSTRDLLHKKLLWFYDLEHSGTNSTPEVLNIIPLEIPGSLISSLEFDTSANANKQQKARISALNKRREAWQKWIINELAKRGIDSKATPCLALVELPANSNPDERNYNEAMDIKTSIRAAMAKAHILSQMIMPIPTEKEPGATEENRAESAISDLLLRQTGSVFTLASEFFTSKTLLGNTDTAKHLHVTALYRERSTEYGVDYPIAVRWYPDGSIKARIPSMGSWEPYWRVLTVLGQYFYDSSQSKEKTQAGNQDNPVNLTIEALAHFLHMIISDQPSGSNLVILQAEDWRSVWKQLRNPQMLSDCLDFSEHLGEKAIYGQQDLSQTRVIRLRQAGTLKETPQYIALRGDQWRNGVVEVEESEELLNETETADDEQGEAAKLTVKNIGGTYASGFIDNEVQRYSSFFHYASIARIPLTADEQQRKFDAQEPKHAEGGKIAFKHQTIVEIVPFFLQSGDNPHLWALLVNFMRSTPAWKQGHILLPYPMHLAAQAVGDMVDVMGLEEQ